MPEREIAELFATLDNHKTAIAYNFEHFRAKHFVSDVQATVEQRGLRPGQLAPDFELPASDGRVYRLSDSRGREAVVLANANSGAAVITFADRFAGYPIRVEVLSRFLTTGEAKKVLEGILSNHTGRTPNAISKESERDRFFAAEEAKAFGLIDHVVEAAPVKPDA